MRPSTAWRSRFSSSSESASRRASSASSVSSSSSAASGRPSRPGGVDPRAEPEADGARVDGGRVDAGGAHQRPQPDLLRARERAQPRDRERAVLVEQRHHVGDRRERDEIEMALRDLRVDPEERLAELVDDAGAAELRERVVGRPRRDDGAVRQRFAGPVVVGDDHLEPARPRLGDLLDRGDPAVDGDDEPAALVGEPRERLGTHAVALVEAARQVPVDLGAELPEQQHGEGGGGDAVDVVVAVDADAAALGDGGADLLRGGLHVAEQERVVRRLLALEEGARDRGVGVPAPDEHGCRQLADPEGRGKVGLHPVRARTDRPGALVHRAATLRGPSDGARLRLRRAAAGGRLLPMPTPAQLREEFLLDPEVTFLNHGSFGACPRPVFERYRSWQLELEREPVRFLVRRLPDLLDAARGRLAEYVGAAPDDIAFVRNATTGVNIVARSLGLRPGDEVLATSLEYGACDLAWERACELGGARYVRAAVPLPIERPEDVVERLFAARSKRTRIVFVSHVTSGTGLVLPVEEIAARARAEGLPVVVDGAHAPAQAPLDLERLGADFYAANCHKWLCAPKGAGFLHVRAEHQDRIDGAIVGWGNEGGGTFRTRVELQGTDDPSAYLAVPDAIDFQAERNWDEVRARCCALAREARDDLCELFATEPIAPPEMLLQMASVALPPCDAEELQRRLFDEYRIEIPVMRRERLLRISVAAYTGREDVERLLDALPRALRTSRSR